MRSRSLMLVLLALVTAGCVDCAPAGPPVTARDVGSGAGPDGGSGDYTFTIQVTDEPGGGPLVGAGVVAYWGGDDVSEWRGEFQGTFEVREEGGVVIVTGEEVHPTPEDRTTARMRTDSQGTVILEVPSNRVFGLVVAASGYTEEWYPSLAAGDRGGSDTITVPLYKQRLNVTVEDTWGPGGVSTGVVTNNNFLWKADLVPFGESDAARRGYGERMVSLRAHLTWTNGPQGAGDLGIGMGATSEQPDYFHDEENELAPGQHGEEFFLDVQQLAEHGVLGSEEVFLGPASDTGYLGPMGLPYTLEAEATFDPAIAALSGCLPERGDEGGLPGTSVPVGTWVPALAVALAAILVGRTRRGAD